MHNPLQTHIHLCSVKAIVNTHLVFQVIATLTTLTITFSDFTVRLSVNGQEIIGEASEVQVDHGSSVSVQCTIIGSKHPDITLIHQNREGNQELADYMTCPKQEMESPVFGRSLSRTCQVSPFQSSGSYLCKASNGFVSKEKKVKITGQYARYI